MHVEASNVARIFRRPNIDKLAVAEDVDGLGALLRHKDPKVRLRAVLALQTIFNEPALTRSLFYLDAARNDSDKEVSIAAQVSFDYPGTQQRQDAIADWKRRRTRG